MTTCNVRMARSDHTGAAEDVSHAIGPDADADAFELAGWIGGKHADGDVERDRPPAGGLDRSARGTSAGAQVEREPTVERRHPGDENGGEVVVDPSGAVRHAGAVDE